MRECQGETTCVVVRGCVLRCARGLMDYMLRGFARAQGFAGPPLHLSQVSLPNCAAGKTVLLLCCGSSVRQRTRDLPSYSFFFVFFLNEDC